jgi:hypothetical protein
VSTQAVNQVTFGDRAKSLVDLFQNTLTILRDLFLLGLFISLLFFPTSLNNTLAKAGVAQVNGGFFTLKPTIQQAASQNASAAQATTTASTTLQDVKSDLQTIAAASHDAATRQALSDAANKVDGTLTNLDQANKTLAASYLAQQDVLKAASGTQAPAAAAAVASLEGWVYLGKADMTGQKWVTPPQPKINNASPELKTGQTITFNDDLFVRGDKPTGGHFNQASTLGAVRAGTSATVLDVQPSPAVNGGNFLWVKISAAQAK